MGWALILHVIAAVIWVGGMFFAWMILRPVAAGRLEPPLRLTLWADCFDRFFPWVWVSLTVILGSGLWMVFAVFGGFAATAGHVHTMTAIGIIMMAIFMHVYFAPYRRLKRAVADQDWPEGGKQLGRVRRLVGLNLLLGLATVAIGSGGRYLVG